MADISITYEVVRIEGENIEPAKLIWRRYKRPAPGIHELFLALNPHLAPHLGTSAYLPVGEIVRIPLDHRLLSGRPPPVKQIRLSGEG